MADNLVKNPWTYVVLVALLVGAFYLGGNVTGNTVAPVEGEADGLAKHLTEYGAVMYGTEWCGYCKKQKELFESSFQYVNYVDCDENKEACLEAGIRGYPTWKIDGEAYPGVQSLEKLSSLTGYSG